MNLQDKVYRDVAKKLGKDVELTEKVCKSIFEFFTEIVREGNNEPYRIQGLGVFEVKDGRRKFIEKAKQRKAEKEAKNREYFNNLEDVHDKG